MITGKYADPRILHENMEKPRAYYIPGHEDGTEACRILNGAWDFSYYESILGIPEEVEGIQFHDTMQVPGCWECAGYGQKQYLNVNYPVPFAPPAIPMVNPVGVYRTTFEQTKTNGRVYIVFEGVSSCMMLYLNGKYVGMSKGSHLQAEFDLTRNLAEGTNTLTALVFTWSSGTYLEDQDAYRYHGIFRDVYLLERPAEHLRDFFIHAGADGNFSVDLEYSGTPAAASIVLVSPDGKEFPVQDGQAAVEHPLLWTAETPNLYKAVFLCAGERIEAEFGFRSVAFSKDRELLINGQSVKLRGVNRHDSDPDKGWAVSKADMERDLKLMKQHNVNCLRTSHYPNHPYIYQLADRLGLYVVDECDIETHGADAAYHGQPAKAIASLSSNPTWKDAYVNRMQRTLGRDKNFPCVIFWSLGNESQIGDNHRAMAAWVHEMDKSRPVHYERTAYPDPPYGKGQCAIDPCVDVVSRMYPDLEGLEYQAKEDPDPRPYFMCEYGHAMGNGPGGLEDYWELIYKYPRLIGGCIWEWCDHAVRMKDANGKVLGFGYGGDSGEFPHDGNFCVDGMVSPDRVPSPGLLSMKNAYRPAEIRAIDAAAGVLEIENHLDFTNLSAFTLRYAVLEDGKETVCGETVLDIAPHAKKQVSLPVTEDGNAKQFSALKVTLATKEGTEWADAGHVLCERAFPLFTAEQPEYTSGTWTLQTGTSDRYRTIEADETVYTLDLATGMLCSVKADGREILSAPCGLTVWRAMTDNERRIKEIFRQLHMHKSRFYVNTVEEGTDGREISFNGFVGAPSRLPFVMATVTYRFDASGVSVSIQAKRNPEFPSELNPEDAGLLQAMRVYLPRFAMRFELTQDFEQLRFLADGPGECYLDSCDHTPQGLYTSTVSEQYFPYIMPQECGNHTNAHQVVLSNGAVSVKVDGEHFEFSALHPTIEELDEASHTWEIPETHCTELLVNYKNSGVGSNSCGPALDRRYALLEDTFEMSFHISVSKA